MTLAAFDLAAVRSFAADVKARLDQCDNGEGMECATLDAALLHYASICCRFRDGVRQWARAVFAGNAAFDPEVERVWKEDGFRLCGRAVEMLAYVHRTEVEGPCYVLDGQAVLQSSLWDLYNLLDRWVSPKLAVGPLARQGLALAAGAAEARRRIEALPPLPADWQPSDPHQQKQYRKLRNRPTS